MTKKNTVISSTDDNARSANTISQKKAYTKPVLLDHGSISDLTQGVFGIGRDSNGQDAPPGFPGGS